MERSLFRLRFNRIAFASFTHAVFAAGGCDRAAFVKVRVAAVAARAAANAGDIPVIVTMVTKHALVWTEVEPLADVILLNYNNNLNLYDEVMAEMVLGQTEPSGLLIQQQPASMEAVEAQLEDVPRDCACYQDANGNVYDFAFGLNWFGVIRDDRVAAYSVAPLTKLASFDFPAFHEAHQ